MSESRQNKERMFLDYYWDFEEQRICFSNPEQVRGTRKLFAADDIKEMRLDLMNRISDAQRYDSGRGLIKYSVLIDPAVEIMGVSDFERLEMIDFSDKELAGYFQEYPDRIHLPEGERTGHGLQYEGREMPGYDTLGLYAEYAALCDIPAADYKKDCLCMARGEREVMFSNMKRHLHNAAYNIPGYELTDVRDIDSFRTRLNMKEGNLRALEDTIEQRVSMTDSQVVHDFDLAEYQSGQPGLFDEYYDIDRNGKPVLYYLPCEDDRVFQKGHDVFRKAWDQEGPVVGSIQFDGYEKVEFHNTEAMKTFIQESFTVGMDPDKVHCRMPGMDLDAKYDMVKHMKSCRGVEVPDKGMWIANYQEKQKAAAAKSKQRNVSDLQVPEENGSGLTAQAEQSAF